jgi:hypothetical protein
MELGVFSFSTDAWTSAENVPADQQVIRSSRSTNKKVNQQAANQQSRLINRAG